MRLFGACLSCVEFQNRELTLRRLGTEEAKRREGLRSAEQQAQAEHKGIWAEEPENVSADQPAHL